MKNGKRKYAINMLIRKNLNKNKGVVHSLYEAF